MSAAQQIVPKQIREQVGRILRTPEFKRSRILSDFLKFVAKETLDGNEENLKEYVIATEVLNKSSDFNPQLDAVVRIHPGRLRNLLDNHYLEAGKNDPVKISIPKGRYIPHFEVNTNENSDAGASSDDLEDLHIKSQQKVDAAVTTKGGYGRWGWYGGYSTTQVSYNEYTEGTLFITLIDEASQNIV